MAVRLLPFVSAVRYYPSNATEVRQTGVVAKNRPAVYNSRASVYFQGRYGQTGTPPTISV